VKVLVESEHCRLIELSYEEKEMLDMGLLNTGQEHKPKNNDDRKEFIGDAVAKVNVIKKYVKENETEERVLVEYEAIRAIPDAKGRETTVVYGDRITKYYREGGGKKSSLAAFYDDMFTAGIEINTKSEEELELSFSDAVNKLAYLRCYVSEFVGDNGEDVRYQAVNVKSEKMLTDENMIPECPI